MATILAATGAFDEIWTGRDATTYGTGAAAGYVLQLEPAIERFEAMWDGSGLDGGIMHGEVECTFAATDEDPATREAACERLYNVACQALDYQALPLDGANTMPAFTFMDKLRWYPPALPIRQAIARFCYRYVLDGSASIDVTT